MVSDLTSNLTWGYGIHAAEEFPHLSLTISTFDRIMMRFSHDKSCQIADTDTQHTR